MAVSVRVIVPSLRKKNAKRVNDKPIKPEKKRGEEKNLLSMGQSRMRLLVFKLCLFEDFDK